MNSNSTTKELPAIAVDFETFYDKKAYSVKSLGNWAYCNDPRFDAYLVSICDGTSTWVGHPKDLNWELLRGRILVSHNAFFDRTVYRRLVALGIAPPGLDERWYCTSNLTAYFCGSARSLASGVAQLIGLELAKDVRDRADGKTADEMKAEGWWTEMLDYARRDAYYCWKLWNDWAPKWPEHERRLSDLTIRNCERGVGLNLELLESYVAWLHAAKFQLEQRIPWVAEGEKPTSPKQLALKCREVNIPVPPAKKDDEEGADRWVEKYGGEFEWVRSIGAWRSVNKTLKRLLLVRARVRPDGRMDFGLKYFGAHCVTGEHEVLTRSGWVPISEWRGGDIAQWSPSGEIQFLAATPNRFVVDEPLYEVRAPYVSAVVTRGHTVPTFGSQGNVFRKYEASNAYGRSQLFVPVSGVLNQIGTLPWSPDECRLLAAVQADGHFTSDGILQWCLRKERKVTRLAALLARLHLPYTQREFPSTPGQVRISVARRDIPEWLAPDKKRFGSWILELPSRSLKAFVEEVPFWDGSPAREGKNAHFYTTSERCARWFLTALHLSGLCGAISTKKEGRNRVESYTVTIRNRATAVVRAKDWSTTRQLVSEVYCPSTKTGYWVVRHEGQIHVTGNTGRYSGDAGFNIQNQRKEPILLREDYLMETRDPEIKSAIKYHDETGRWPEWVKFVVDERALLVPGPGKKYVISDLSQIEPRVLNTVIGNAELLDKIRSGLGIYEAFARTALNYTDPAPLKSKDKKLYALAKAEVLGLGYQCGPKRFPEVAMTMAGIEVSEEDSERIVKEFRANNPKIVALWNQLDAGFKSSVGHDFEMVLPSGRVMTYRKVMRQIRPEVDEETGQTKIKAVFTAIVGDRRHTFYGGKLTENLVQAIARDVFVGHILALDEAGIHVPFSVHDEAVCEVDLDTPKSVVESVMSVAPVWMPGCPVACEAVEANRYLK